MASKAAKTKKGKTPHKTPAGMICEFCFRFTMIFMVLKLCYRLVTVEHFQCLRLCANESNKFSGNMQVAREPRKSSRVGIPMKMIQKRKSSTQPGVEIKNLPRCRLIPTKTVKVNCLNLTTNEVCIRFC